MATATITRGGTTVTLPLVTDSSGSPVIARDLGKPHLDIQNSGALEPRHIDNWSGLEQYTLVGQYTSSTAYTDAIALADLIKSNSGGTNTTLTIDVDDYEDNMTVAPAAGQDEALSLTYEPGRRKSVGVDLSLTRVSETQSGDTQGASTPTASGSGPIQLTDGNRVVDMTDGVTVTRGVGRPKSVIRRSPSKFPYHIDKRKAAYDAFELSFDFTDSAVSKIDDVVNMVSRKLQRNALTLDFNGLFGMGSFNVVPEGSGAVRHVRRSGEQGIAGVPTVTLRRVL